MPLDEALAIARQIADALEAAHEKGIIHRDLKPANIKLTPDGTVKVLDFGLAKITEAGVAGGSPDNSPTYLEQATRAGMILGTAAYMAPEQARGKPVDKRADIWAFGVVLYEMLTGRRLFRGETDFGYSGGRADPGPGLELRAAGDGAFAAPLPGKRSETTLAGYRRRSGVGSRGVPEPPAPSATCRGKSAPGRWRLSRWSRSYPCGDPHAGPRLRAAAQCRPRGACGGGATPRCIHGRLSGWHAAGVRHGQPMVKARLALRRLDQSKAVPLAGTDGA